MTVSTTVDYTDTRADIIKDALMQLRVIDIDEDPEGKTGEYVNRELNRLIKSWQSYGPNLWKRSTGYIFIDPSVREYKISSSSTQHFTGESYKYTTLSAAALAGVSSIAVNSTSNMNAGDYLGIVQDDNTRFWTTINSIGIGTVDFSPDVLPANSASGSKVVYYTNKLEKPFNILSVNRISVSQALTNEIPLKYLSYQDFFEIPNKDSLSVPTMYNYDRQLDEAIIRVWPLPSNFVYDISFTFQKIFFDFDTNANSPDFPQEWYRAIVLNLAVACAASFGKNVGQSYQNLKIEASEAVTAANSFDNEQGSLFIQPNNEGNPWL